MAATRRRWAWHGESEQGVCGGARVRDAAGGGGRGRTHLLFDGALCAALCAVREAAHVVAARQGAREWQQRLALAHALVGHLSRRPSKLLLHAHATLLADSSSPGSTRQCRISVRESVRPFDALSSTDDEDRLNNLALSSATRALSFRCSSHRPVHHPLSPYAHDERAGACARARVPTLWRATHTPGFAGRLWG